MAIALHSLSCAIDRLGWGGYFQATEILALLYSFSCPSVYGALLYCIDK